MKTLPSLLLALVIGLLWSIGAMAQNNSEDQLAITDLTLEENTGLAIEDFLWQKRVFIIFSDSPFDPNFIEQVGFLEQGISDLMEREVVVLMDSQPAVESAIRAELRPRGFAIILIGKDGIIYLRKPTTWNVREISNTIDKFPIRQQELRSKN